MATLDDRLAALASRILRSRPVSEPELMGQIIDSGFVDRLLRFDTVRYAAFLQSFVDATIEPALPAWRAVPEAVSGGRESVLRAVADGNQEAIEVSALQFARDIGVATGAFLARGAAFACVVNGGYSRGSCVRYGWQQLLTRPTLLSRVLRTAPRIELHTNVRLIGDFSEVSWRRMYETLALVCSREPEFDALVTTAWYMDPSVAAVSPRLGYMSQLPNEGGALIIPLPPTESDTSYALENSATRREAFNEGRYQPRPTFMYWGREELINWASHPVG